MHIDINFFSLYTISKIAFDQYSSGILYKYINNFPDWKFFFHISYIIVTIASAPRSVRH